MWVLFFHEFVLHSPGRGFEAFDLYMLYMPIGVSNTEVESVCDLIRRLGKYENNLPIDPFDAVGWTTCRTEHVEYLSIISFLFRIVEDSFVERLFRIEFISLRRLPLHTCTAPNFSLSSWTTG